MSPWEEEVSPSLPARSHGEPLDGASHHGLLQVLWHATGGAHDDAIRAAFEEGEAQATESVGDELEAHKADGFTKGKVITGECSPPITETNADDGTIGTASGKHGANPPS
jgi:hypothetical protein